MRTVSYYRVLALCLLVLGASWVLSGPVSGQPAQQHTPTVELPAPAQNPRNINPSKDVPALFQFMIWEFFSPYFARGTGAVWSQCKVPLVIAGLLMGDFLRRKAWTR